ncbi:Protein mahjong [Pseudolycoriella hygida]|uniref:Protein mahjong n=1 Tax=Pseudolycoriella hygida TaxID=35572 RepID=A0A9Q0S7B9_9DIPT|nr:Protein mahjong [Pseudolycoriella hygida]
MHRLCSNIAGRCLSRQQGYNPMQLDRRLVHSHFCMDSAILSRTGAFFRCCDFTSCTYCVVVGLQNGEVRVYDSKSGNEYISGQCHKSSVNDVQWSKTGDFLLTSCSSFPFSKMWYIERNEFFLRLEFKDEEYLKFSNLNEDKILGTGEEMATMYDTDTGKIISTYRGVVPKGFSRMRATFSPCDELVLSEGILWDVRSGQMFHNFKSLYPILSGVFHPNGWEILINGNVCDMRTLHVLKTVPELHQSTVTFSPQNIIYGVTCEVEPDSGGSTGQSFDKVTTFTTLDSSDYSKIAEIDVKRKIYHLSVNKYGNEIALVENLGNDHWDFESVVRIYTVGKPKLIAEDEEGYDSDTTDSSTTSATETDGKIDFYLNKILLQTEIIEAMNYSQKSILGI